MCCLYYLFFIFLLVNASVQDSMNSFTHTHKWLYLQNVWGQNKKITNTKSNPTVLKTHERSCADLAKIIPGEGRMDRRHLAERFPSMQKWRQPKDDAVLKRQGIYLNPTCKRSGIKDAGEENACQKGKREGEVSCEACDPNHCVHHVQGLNRQIWALMT